MGEIKQSFRLIKHVQIYSRADVLLSTSDYHMMSMGGDTYQSPTCFHFMFDRNVSVVRQDV